MRILSVHWNGTAGRILHSEDNKFRHKYQIVGNQSLLFMRKKGKIIPLISIEDTMEKVL